MSFIIWSVDTKKMRPSVRRKILDYHKKLASHNNVAQVAPAAPGPSVPLAPLVPRVPTVSVAPPAAPTVPLSADNKIDIDFVYSYIDGNDKDIIQQKEKIFGATTPAGNKPASMRYRVWGELEASLKSVKKFAPWVRKVFIVAPNQEPEWFKRGFAAAMPPAALAATLPAVLVTPVVPSTPTIFEWLPESKVTGNRQCVFNSLALETCLHEVPGLSEYFVYFCDDYFLGAPTRPDDFFDIINRTSSTSVASNTAGANVSQPSVVVRPRIHTMPGQCQYRLPGHRYRHAWQGNLGTANVVLDRIFGARKPRPALAHCCAPLTRSLFINAMQNPIARQSMEQTRRTIGRQGTCVHSLYLVSFWGLATGLAVSRNVSSCYKYSELTRLSKTCLEMKHSHGKTLFYCLNDARESMDDKTAAGIHNILRDDLPHNW